MSDPRSRETWLREPWLRGWISQAMSGAAEREYRCVRGDPRTREQAGVQEEVAIEVGVNNEVKAEVKAEAREVEWIAVRRAPLPATAGLSSILILRDITADKRLEGEREQMRCRQALAEMSALLAHEVRNPLGSLELFAGLLAGAELNQESRNWVAHLQAGLRLLGATVNNVLHFHSQPALGLAPTDLGNLLAWLEQFLRPLAQQARVRLDLHQELDRVEIAADRHRLEQVVLNLALNAFRFMPHGGVLKITGRVQRAGKRQTARVEMADTGCGIAAENVPRIFAAGFTTRAGSPGLGLAVCRTIMQQHGGSIAVSSRLRQGSRFTLEFPLPEATRNVVCGYAADGPGESRSTGDCR